MEPDNGSRAHSILFGLNRSEDERSLAIFLQLFSRPQLTETLIPRMSDTDIQQTVAFLTGIMRKHLNEQEYHHLFLGEDKQGH